MKFSLPGRLLNYENKSYIGKDGSPKTFESALVRIGSVVLEVGCKKVSDSEKLVSLLDKDCDFEFELSAYQQKPNLSLVSVVVQGKKKDERFAM